MKRLKLEGMRVIFKNFRGEKGTYNSEGDRSFSLVFDNTVVGEEIGHMGWAVKPLRNEEGEIETYHLPVKVNYGGRMPPRIYKVSVSGAGQVLLEERTISMLDYLPIEYVDVILHPYEWEVRGESGVKAYCGTMYVVIEENELDLKWANFSKDDIPFEAEE